MSEKGPAKILEESSEELLPGKNFTTELFSEKLLGRRIQEKLPKKSQTKVSKKYLRVNIWRIVVGA